jgi:GTPase KRas protein
MDVDDKPAVVDIIDTAGAEDFLWSRTAIKGADAFLCVYAINDESSFKRAIEIVKDVLLLRSQDEDMDDTAQTTKPAATAPVILVGTKCDLESEREVTIDQGQHCAKLFDKTLNVCKFVETSALTGKNVDHVFQEAVRSVRQYRKAQRPKRRGGCIVM